MRIATWNINGLRARCDFVLHWLEARKPDIVGLQELKLTDEQFPIDVFEAAGYSAITHGQKAWNGVAVLSRKPPELIQRGLTSQEDLGARQHRCAERQSTVQDLTLLHGQRQFSVQEPTLILAVQDLAPIPNQNSPLEPIGQSR